VVESLATAKHVRKVRFVLFDAGTLKAYTQAAEKLSQRKPGSQDQAGSQYQLEKGSP